jgi:hypothetical protein
MSLVWSNQGADYLGGTVVGLNTTAIVVKIGLFCANRAIAYGDVYATIAASYDECTDATYARITLTGTTWSENATYPKNGVSQFGYPQQTFTFAGGGGQTVYGYFLILAVSSNLLWGGELISPSYAIPGGGGSLLVTPSVELGEYANMP